MQSFLKWKIKLNASQGDGIVKPWASVRLEWVHEESCCPWRILLCSFSVRSCLYCLMTRILTTSALTLCCCHGQSWLDDQLMGSWKSLPVPYLLPQWSNWSILLKPAGKGSVSHDGDPGNHLAQKEFPFFFHVICKGRAWPDGKTSEWMCWLVWGILKTLSVRWVKKNTQSFKLYVHR